MCNVLYVSLVLFVNSKLSSVNSSFITSFVIITINFHFSSACGSVVLISPIRDSDQIGLTFSFVNSFQAMTSEKAFDLYFDELMDISEFGDRVYYEELRNADKEREKALAAKTAKEAAKNRRKKEREQDEYDDDERKEKNKLLAQNYLAKINASQYRNENIESLFKQNVTGNTASNVHSGPSQSNDRMDAIEQLYGNRVKPKNEPSEKVVEEKQHEIAKKVDVVQPPKIKKDRKKKNALLNALKKNNSSSTVETEESVNGEEVDLVDKFLNLLPKKCDRDQENTESGSSSATSLFDMETKKQKYKKKTSQRRRLLLSDSHSPPPAKPFTFVPCSLKDEPPVLTSTSMFPPLS